MYFQSSRFFPALGWGIKVRDGTSRWGVGLIQEREEGIKKRIEYFVIVQTEGDTVCIYLYCIYVIKCVGFLCDTTFYLYYGSTFSVSMLIIYIFVLFFLILSLSFLVFVIFLFRFFPRLSCFCPFGYCTVYYFCCPLRWHSYSLYWFSAINNSSVIKNCRYHRPSRPFPQYAWMALKEIKYVNFTVEYCVVQKVI